MTLSTNRAGPLNADSEHAEDVENAVRFLINRGYAVEVLGDVDLDGPPPIRVFLEGDDETFTMRMGSGLGLHGHLTAESMEQLAEAMVGLRVRDRCRYPEPPRTAPQEES